MAKNKRAVCFTVEKMASSEDVNETYYKKGCQEVATVTPLELSRLEKVRSETCVVVCESAVAKKKRRLEDVPVGD
jgi:hypothetical protein